MHPWLPNGLGSGPDATLDVGIVGGEREITVPLRTNESGMCDRFGDKGLTRSRTCKDAGTLNQFIG